MAFCPRALSFLFVVALAVSTAFAGVRRGADVPSDSQTPNYYVWGCLPGNISSGFRFCDSNLTIGERVSDLIQRMTLLEKLAILGPDSVHTTVSTCNMMDSGVLRLGIPAYMNLVETNTAVASACIKPGVCATNFPGPANLAASFNRTLWRAKGTAISDEMRALSNFGWHRATDDAPYSKIGLTGFGPNMNIARDPRFGRTSELPGEDPFLTGMYAMEYVQGCQNGSDPRYLKMIAGLKHYDAYSVETGRGNRLFNISMFDLWDTYLPQYGIAFDRNQGNAMAVMCSYAGVNGVPSCANDYLLNKVIRGKFGRPEVVVASDCGAIGNMLSDDVIYAKNDSDAAAKALNGGCDLDLGDQYYSPGWSGGADGLTQAIREGMTTEAIVDLALGRVLEKRFMAGLFDPLDQQVYTKIPIEVVGSEQHQALILEGALQGIVLLKNVNNTLPFASGRSLAVLGPHAFSTRDLMEDYKGDQQCFGGNEDCVPTIGNVFAMLNGVDRTTVMYGVDMDSSDDSGIAPALSAAASADQIVLCLGIGNAQEHEGIDRDVTTLPGLQESFALKVLALGKPTVIVLVNGGILSIDNLVAPAPAIVEAFYPSTQGALALYKALFGLENRWGRMPLTVYPADYINQVDLFNFDMSKAPGRTYRYYTGTPLFEFGFGLSYTSFSLACESSFKVQILADGTAVPPTLSFACDVSNTGSVVGDDVVMVYHNVSSELRLNISSLHAVPLRALVEFARVGPVLPGAKVSVPFTVQSTRVLALTNSDGDRVIYPGAHVLVVSDGVNTNQMIVDVQVPSGSPFVVVDQAVRP
eukprot:gnl/Spiro4/9155_TR4822_c0_g1_i1.p1 gnl/Spiro4/9155_TR4822_c0_g1~~gnl/Spiro4/9155_TR4822_c0_g1_i1.p1  ORF type:complete len:824 (-),score=178.02 gnl/Spiro4/9155_TR4822_c0_g1_i1:109-2538(-)